MTDSYNLQRFIDAQAPAYDRALRELKAGRKQTHWMWFIFPQIAGLGRSADEQISPLTQLNRYTLAQFVQSHL